MPTLRINQHPGRAENRYRIEVSSEGIPGFQPQSLTTEIEFALSPQDRARIRWYFEDFLEFDQHPAQQIAKRVEQLMADIGKQLFRGIFEGSDDLRELWAAIRPRIADTRIEVTTEVIEATAIPWELIRDPRLERPLALSAQAFVRSQRDAIAALLPGPRVDKVRVLLVISRPKGAKDVPFRSVALRLATRLSDADREAFDLHVLRPPTYERLASTLRLAKEARRPYHIVHFDGHGVYADPTKLSDAGRVLSDLRFDAGPTGVHGFLMFENPNGETRSEFVDGFKLGALLRESDVPLLLLNACQSAFAETPAHPELVTPKDAREEILAYGSLAQAAVDAGAAGVVAMRYSVYVATASQFVAELYGALARGRALGEAVTWARRNLADQPERSIAYRARPLQDWSVPVVWERGPLRLWPEMTGGGTPHIRLEDRSASKPGALDSSLPDRPDVGFCGHDEALYALDRAFDTHRIVLLHAYAGSGKTATAAEFARWYALTGGVEGPVLFSSFEHHMPLARVLDKIGAVFGPALRANNVQWDAITDSSKRRDMALQLLKKIPVLWIWDNVEPVTGFPSGTDSEWTADEQQELRAFLSAARDTRAKFLLTSRRDERAWLGDLPRRVCVPPMPMRERLQLSGAIAERFGKRLADLPDLTPLLRFTRGNPMTVLITVRQVLRSGIRAEDRLEAFVEELRHGEAAFDDEEAEGRSKSLGASLSYGFRHAFSEDERKVLALLHLFQSFVDVEALRYMGDPEAKWCLPEVRGLTRKRGIALLHRATEVGLLSRVGDGYYNMHPALPWYFRGLFERNYPAASGDARRVRGAFVDAMAVRGNFFHDQYNEGHRSFLSVLAEEEDNLLAAWRLARELGRWDAIIGVMQGLRMLYEDTGRVAAWGRLVAAVVPDFVDPITEGPLPGREEEGWAFVTEYRGRFALFERRLEDAETLQRLRLSWDRKRAGPALETPPHTWDDRQRNTIRSLALSLQHFGFIQLEQGEPACADTYREAYDLAGDIGDNTLQAIISLHLGTVYKNILGLRDLDQAKRWYLKSLYLWMPHDHLGQSKCLNQLGLVAFERFKEALAAGRPAAELAYHLDEAARFHERVLEMLPEDAIAGRAVAHNQLFLIYELVGGVNRALRHGQEAIRLSEREGNYYLAGQRRSNVAVALRRAGRLPEARLYAKAALANFIESGDGAAIRKTEQLIADIDRALAQQGGGV